MSIQGHFFNLTFFFKKFYTHPVVTKPSKKYTLNTMHLAPYSPHLGLLHRWPWCFFGSRPFAIILIVRVWCTYVCIMLFFSLCSPPRRSPCSSTSWIVRSTSPCLLVWGEVRPLFFIEELVSVRWFITTFVGAVSIFFLSSFNNTLILQLTKSNLFPEGRGIVIMSTFNWSNCRLW